MKSLILSCIFFVFFSLLYIFKKKSKKNFGSGGDGGGGEGSGGNGIGGDCSGGEGSVGL